MHKGSFLLLRIIYHKNYQTKTNVCSKILLTDTNICSILINSETQEDLSNHTNGAGNTSESDKSSHTYIHTNSYRNGKNLNEQKRSC